MGDTPSIALAVSVNRKDVTSNLAAIAESVKRLGLVTETTFAKQNMGALGVKNFADVRAEMARLTTAYRDLKTSGKASTGELGKALEELRGKQRELYATISNPPKLDLARSVLGLSSGRSISLEINKVRTAYADLVKSGKLSLQELYQAKVAMGKKLDELKKKTNDWRDSLGQIKGRAVEAAAAGAALVLSAKAGIDFESAMADVRKVVDGTPKEIADLAKELQGMSRVIPLTAVELAKIATAGGQLGIASKDIGAFVEVTAKMATAFDMTADEAGNAIGKLKNVFGLSIPEIVTFGDAINQLGNTTAAREKDIVDVMLRVGGTSKQFGLAKEQTAALAAAMLSLGKTPETASTSINALLNNMQTATMGSKQFQEALAKIGTDAEAMAASVAANPQKALLDLLGTLEKLDGQKRAEVLTGLFGKEFQDDIGLLVGSLQTYRDTMQQVSDSNAYAGAMLAEFKVRAASTGNQLILLKNKVVEIATNVGTGLLPAIKLAAVVLSALLTPIADLTGEFPRLSAAILALGTGVVVFSTIAKVAGIAKTAMLSFSTATVPALGRVGVAVKLLGTAMKTMGGLLSAALIGWEVGKWLNTFSPIQKGMTSLIYSADRVQLAARKMWAALTGGDVAAIDQQIAIAKQAYDERLKEIDKEAADKNKPEGKPQETPAQVPPPDNQPPPPDATDNKDKPISREQEAMDTWHADKLNEEQRKERQERLGTLDSTEEIARKKATEEEKLRIEKDASEKSIAIAENTAKAKQEVSEKVETPDPGILSRFARERLGLDRKPETAEPESQDEPTSGDSADNDSEEEQRKRDREDQARKNRQFAAEEKEKAASTALQAEQDITKANADRIDAAKQGAEEWAQAETQAVEKAKSVFQKYADKVRSIQDDIAGRERSLADELDSMDTRGTEESRWRKKAKEAKDYEKAAKEAMKAGDLQKALSLSDQAKAAYSGLQGGAGSVSDKLGDQAAFRGVKSSGQLGIEISKAIQAATAKTALTAMPGSDMFGDLSGRIRGQLAAVAGGNQGQAADKGAAPVEKIHELKFAGGSMRGGEADVEALLNLLAQAGMSAG